MLHASRVSAPHRQCEPFAVEIDIQRRRLNPHTVSQAERGFEADAPETNRVQISFVRVAEPAQGLELLLVKILAVVFEHELVVYYPHAGGLRPRVIRVLQKLGEHMARTLHLSKKLPPRTGQDRVFELLPQASRYGCHAIEIGRRVHPARLSRCPRRSFTRKVTLAVAKSGSCSKGLSR